MAHGNGQRNPTPDSRPDQEKGGGPTAFIVVPNLFVLRNLLYTKFYDILAGQDLRAVFVTPRPHSKQHVERSEAPNIVHEDMYPTPHNPLDREYRRRVEQHPRFHGFEQAWARFDRSYLWRTLLYRFNYLNGFANLRLRLAMSREQQSKEMRFSNFFPACTGQPAVGSPLVFSLLHRLRTCPWPLFSDAWTRLLFDHHRPDVVVLGFSQAAENRAFVVEARRREIPVLGIVNSWDHATTKGPLPRGCDALVVGCDALRDELIRHHDVPAERIHLLGSTYYDSFQNPALHQSREEFFRPWGIPVENKLIAFFTNTNTIKDHEPGVARRLIRLARDNAWGQPVTLFLRLHPHDLLFQELSALHDPPHVVVTRGNTFGHLGQDSKGSSSDTANYVNLLRHADVVLNTGSTVSLDGLVFDKPVICLGFDGDMQPPPSDRVEVRYQWEHLSGLLDTGAVNLVRSYEALEQGVTQAFQGKGAPPEAIQRARERYLEPLDDKASARLFQLVADMAAQRGPRQRPNPSLARARWPLRPKKKSPSPWPAYLAALAARRFGLVDTALRCYRRALSKEPFMEAALIGHARLCKEAGRRPETREAFRRLQELFPDRSCTLEHAKGLFAEALENVRAGRSDPAMQALDEILYIYRPEGGGYWQTNYLVLNAMQLKGGIFARAGETEAALELFRAILKVAPERLDVLLNSSDALRYAGRFQEAGQALDRLERAAPEHPELKAKRLQLEKAAARERDTCPETLPEDRPRESTRRPHDR